MTHILNSSIVRVVGKRGAVGGGMLVGERQVLTCAHVVQAALGLAVAPVRTPTEVVKLEFPFAEARNARFGALVVTWRPLDDIAILELNDSPPPDAHPVYPLQASSLSGHRFEVYGFPWATKPGEWAFGIIQHQNEHGLIQLEAEKTTGFRIRKGFSGCPLWDTDMGGVVGIVTAHDADRTTRVGWMIPIAKVHEVGPLRSVREIARLNRGEWLQAHGFITDPFPIESFQAETDPALQAGNLTAYVDFPEYEKKLRGSPSNPGATFIFGPRGSGKSSLRRRIKYDFDESVEIGLALNQPRVLAVEYVDHHYPLNAIDAQSHASRIAQLVSKALAQTVPVADSPLETLQNTLNSCRLAGLDGLCVLVDNISTITGEDPAIAFRRIQSLATRFDLLGFNGLFFKFMLSTEVFEIAKPLLPLDRLSFERLQWTERLLARVMGERLLDSSDALYYRAPPETPLNSELAGIVLFDVRTGTNPLNNMIQFGLSTQRVRAMWHLGYEVINRFFAKSADGRRYATEKIGWDIFINALDELTRLYLSQAAPSFDSSTPQTLEVVESIPNNFAPSSNQAPEDRQLTGILYELNHTLKSLNETLRILRGDSHDGSTSLPGGSTPLIAPEGLGTTSNHDHENWAKTIREAISKGEFDDAISLANRRVDDILRLIEFRFNSLKKETVTSEERRVERIRITTDLLAWLNNKEREAHDR